MSFASSNPWKFWLSRLPKRRTAARSKSFWLHLESLESRLAPAVIMVTTTADDISPGDGSVSLREAITAINAGNDLGDHDIAMQNPGTFGTNDAIHFMIPTSLMTPGSGLFEIIVGSDPRASQIPLPAIIKPVTIDGYSQPGSRQNTLPDSDNALLLIEVDGDSIAPQQELGGAMVELTVAAGNSTVRGLVMNFAIEKGGSQGIALQTGDDNIIEGNIITGCDTGVVVVSRRNTVGGTAPGARNVISGNRDGILITSSENRVLGNFIGTDASGTRPQPNSSIGIYVVEFSSDNLVGGTAVGARNTISGNGEGVQIDGFLDSSGAPIGATGNLVQGNFIGTDATGTAVLRNLGNGISILQASGNTIGGTAPGAGNVISGNDGDGVAIFFAGNLVQGNSIGTDFMRRANLGNVGNGVSISASSNTIGGTSAGAENIIAYNRSNGILVSDGTGNAIRRNSIYLNTKLGIDLGGNGATANDAGDADSGPNNLQNFPEIRSATLFDGTLTLALRVSSDAANSASPLTLEFFLANPNGPNNLIMATATDAAGNTSEFSPVVIATTDGSLTEPESFFLESLTPASPPSGETYLGSVTYPLGVTPPPITQQVVVLLANSTIPPVFSPVIQASSAVLETSESTGSSGSSEALGTAAGGEEFVPIDSTKLLEGQGLSQVGPGVPSGIDSGAGSDPISARALGATSRVRVVTQKGPSVAAVALSTSETKDEGTTQAESPSFDEPASFNYVIGLQDRTRRRQPAGLPKRSESRNATPAEALRAAVDQVFRHRLSVGPKEPGKPAEAVDWSRLDASILEPASGDEEGQDAVVEPLPALRPDAVPPPADLILNLVGAAVLASSAYLAAWYEWPARRRLSCRDLAWSRLEP